VGVGYEDGGGEEGEGIAEDTGGGVGGGEGGFLPFLSLFFPYAGGSIAGRARRRPGQGQAPPPRVRCCSSLFFSSLFLSSRGVGWRVFAYPDNFYEHQESQHLYVGNIDFISSSNQLPLQLFVVVKLRISDTAVREC